VSGASVCACSVDPPHKLHKLHKLHKSLPIKTRKNRKVCGTTMRIGTDCGRRVFVPSLSSLPLWTVALVVAAIAPWCVRAFSRALERRVHRRTVDTIARAKARSSQSSQ
jgi:hypothetical protein